MPAIGLSLLAKPDVPWAASYLQGWLISEGLRGQVGSVTVLTSIPGSTSRSITLGNLIFLTEKKGITV